MDIEFLEDKVLVKGHVSYDEMRKDIPRKARCIDFSQAELDEKMEGYIWCCRGYSHSGPVGEYQKKIDAFVEFLEEMSVAVIVLPPSVTRKQLNTCLRKWNVPKIIVSENCKLFSMKDGNIWNKKGTILIYEQKLSV